jgi:CBS domain-containing protein
MLTDAILLTARERLATAVAGAPLRAAAELMSKPHTDLVVACDYDGRMIGVLTKTDIVRRIGLCSGGGCTVRVDAIMTRKVASCRTSAVLHDVWLMMKERGLQRIPPARRSQAGAHLSYGDRGRRHSSEGMAKTAADPSHVRRAAAVPARAL